MRRRASSPASSVRGHTEELLDVRRVEPVRHRRAERAAHDVRERVGAGACGTGSSPCRARDAPTARAAACARDRSAGGGNATKRPAIRMRPLRGRRWRSAPSSSRNVAMIGAGVDGCRRWLPWSTRCPATSKLAASPPTCGSRSRTVTRRPAPREAVGRAEPGRAAAEHDDVGVEASASSPVTRRVRTRLPIADDLHRDAVAGMELRRPGPVRERTRPPSSERRPRSPGRGRST